MPLLLATPLIVAPPVLRHQQQPWCLDGIRGDNVDPGLDASFSGPRSGLVLVCDVIDLTDAPVFDDNFTGDRVVHQFRALVGRIVQRDRRVVFGLDRADRNAIGVAGASAAIPVRLGIACRRQASHLDPGDRLLHPEKSGLLIRQLGERLGHPLIEHEARNPRHRVFVVWFRKADVEKALLRLVRGNAEFGLRPVVPWTQFLGVDVFWPVRKRKVRNLGPVFGLHSEICRHQSQARAEPMRRTARKTFVSAGEGLRPLLDEVALFGILPVGSRERQNRWSAGGHFAGITQTAIGLFSSGG